MASADRNLIPGYCLKFTYPTTISKHKHVNCLLTLLSKLRPGPKVYFTRELRERHSRTARAGCR
jgi:hypothetical protein